MAAKIITFANIKGGVAKTTTSVHLACFLSKTKKTLLIDGDPQESSATWASWRNELIEGAKKTKGPTTICLKGDLILNEGKKFANDYDYIIVDVGGKDSTSLRNALILADLIIVPTGTSGFDAAALVDFLTLVKLVREVKDGLKIYYLLTKVDPRTKDLKEMREFLNNITDPSLIDGICESFISERVAYKRSTGEGRVVEETNDKNAINEMAKFYKEVLSLWR